MKKLLLCVMAVAMSTQAHARDAIRVVGSSTVYPFMASAAEHFGEQSSKPTPVVEETGTGMGIADFCKGVGEAYADMVDASRPMKSEEKALCYKAGVKDIREFMIGYDGIVLASSKQAQPIDISLEQLFMALSANVAVDGKVVANPYKKWSEISKNLPDTAIEVYGPPSTSGTYDAFIEIVLQGACMKHAAFVKQYPTDDARKKACSTLRTDGLYKPATENDNIIVQKLKANPKAFGIFGYSYLEENKDTIQGAKVNGVAPEFEAISSEKYPVSRALYVYVKGEHLKKFPEIKGLMTELFSDAAMGELGYLPSQGLILLHEDKLAEQRKAVEGL